MHAGVPVLFPDPRHLAVGLGFELLPRAPRVTCGEAASQERVAYTRRINDPQAQGIEVFHGLAHAILWEERDCVSENDAWMLAALICVPPRMAEYAASNMDEATAHAPEWFVLAAIGANERVSASGKTFG